MNKDSYMLGKEVSGKIKSLLLEDVKKLKNIGIVPKLAAVLVGDDPASKIYVNSKKKTFIKMNCLSDVYHLDKNIKESELINKIIDLNNDDDIHGILLQCPLPKHLSEDKIISYINPDKDVDGLHPINLGLLMQGKPNFIPCTPLGCIEILKYYNIDVESKNIVIIGRSNLVGKPLFALLSQKFKIGNATVTLCHSKSRNIDFYTKNADIIIVAIGSPKFLKSNMVKKNAIIIDVGINRVNDNSDKGYHIVGDADFDNLNNKVGYITPVPGGVGPMTITMLLHNTINSAKSFSNKIDISKYR
tara:strand:+ start:1698 stop:2603 length:906 start_codon:yes stop_codon:yes gene_type:complete